MAEDMYIVLVTHSTGHGDVTNPVIITQDIYTAINTARKITTLDYEFYTSEHVVCIYKLTPDMQYKKGDFTWFIHQDSSEQCIMTRRYMPEKEWEEEWHDTEAKYIVDGFETSTLN